MTNIFYILSHILYIFFRYIYTKLYLQEYLLPVHHPQDEIYDGSVAEGDECRVKIAHIVLQAVKERARYATEVNASGKHVGHDGVHAIHLEPTDVFVAPSIVDEPIEESHQNEAVATAHKHHRACPQFLDDRHL